VSESKTDLLFVALRASIEAGHEILKIYGSNFKSVRKEDKSPLTEADIISNQVINFHLEKTNIPIVSEENPIPSYSIRKNWEAFWMVDPLDGTKEFLKRNGEFTVNIALVAKGELKFGVIYVPVTRELYYTNSTKSKAYKTLLKEDEDLEEKLFQNKDIINPLKQSKSAIKVVVSKSHLNDKTVLFVKHLEGTYSKVTTLARGSSLKFCLIAEGGANVYPRFGPTMEWDTAAGQAICEAVGLKVIDQSNGSRLSYNKESLLNKDFLVTS